MASAVRRSSAVPKAMQVQLARLFGSSSGEARAKARTPAEWKKTLTKVLGELERYLDANIHTDELHFFLLMGCLMAGRESLKEEDFFAGYAEAVTRLALLLMGDYPDHRRRKTGLKKADHYSLARHRSVVFSPGSEPEACESDCRIPHRLPGWHARSVRCTPRVSVARRAAGHVQAFPTLV